MGDIIKFEDYNKRKNLSDDEIKSLFLGLVNLIKSNAIEKVSKKIKDDYKQTSIKLNNTILELKIKNQIIEDLQKENESLKTKTTKLYEKIEELSKRNINKF